MKQFLAEVVGNRQIAKNYFDFSFTWPNETDPPVPGQFLNIRCSEGTSPLLRRPFAFSGYDRDRRVASIIFEVRGRGTEILSTKKTGDRIDLIAPLGNDFFRAYEVVPCSGSVRQTAVQDKDTLRVLVSGGIGFGPMRFLAEYLKENGLRYLFIHGARDAGFLPDVEVTEGLNAVFCTDNGTSGFHGTTTRYLDSISGRLDGNSLLYACGPLPMLRGCHDFAVTHDFDCIVSMEQIMGCGFGACMGCVIKIEGGSGFARVCEEGPVFSSRSIVWT